MSPTEPPFPVDANGGDANEIEMKATGQIQSLNEDYEKLFRIERCLVDELHQLQEDEVKLRQALDEAKESKKEKFKREQKEKNDHAIKNLEKALLMDDDSSSDEDEHGDGADAAVGFPGLEDALFKDESLSLARN